MNEVSRRSVVTGIAAGLPFAAVLADPILARAVAAGLETVTITTAGGKKVGAALAVPAAVKAPAVLVVHEWWGLNDQVKATAAEFAAEGYLALAVDLYDGQVATDADSARKYRDAMDQKAAGETVAAWARWLKTHPRGTGKVGSVGFCLGGGWSLMTGVLEPIDATVVYYGKVDLAPEQLAKLKGPVLGHYATRDQWINREMVGRFEAAMTQVGKPFASHWYEAEHAFANPTGARYHEENAKVAWRRTLDFFGRHLKG
jgi:carboxymethylenebutenolidase